MQFGRAPAKIRYKDYSAEQRRREALRFADAQVADVCKRLEEVLGGEVVDTRISESAEDIGGVDLFATMDSGRIVPVSLRFSRASEFTEQWTREMPLRSHASGAVSELDKFKSGTETYEFFHRSFIDKDTDQIIGSLLVDMSKIPSKFREDVDENISFRTVLDGGAHTLNSVDLTSCPEAMNFIDYEREQEREREADHLINTFAYLFVDEEEFAFSF